MIIEGVLILISLILMPFVVHENGWRIKLIYLCLCGVFTPIIGIPLYKILGGH